MKVVILAGGWGTRIGRQAEDIPKPMVQIGGKPMLWHIMKLYGSQGFTDFIVSSGVKSNIIKNYFTNFKTYNKDFTVDTETGMIEYHDSGKDKWRVTVVDTGLNTLKGARIKRVEKYLDAEINMVTYGDGIANVNLKSLLDFHISHGKTITVTGVRPPARFGEIIQEDGHVKVFREKPQVSQGLINGGFMVFNRTLLSYLNVEEECDFERGPLEDLAKEDEVMVYKHTGDWECMDHQRDVAHLNSLWSTGQAFWKLWE